MSPPTLDFEDIIDEIFAEATSGSHTRGRRYFLEKRVLNAHFQDGEYFGMVRGTRNYRASIDLETGYTECECPAYQPCKHIIALLHHLREEDARGSGPAAGESSGAAVNREEILIRILPYLRYVECLARDTVTGKVRSIINRRSRGGIPEKEWRVLLSLLGYEEPVLASVHEVLTRAQGRKKSLEEWPVFHLPDGQPVRFRGRLPVEIQVEELQDGSGGYFIRPVVQLPGREEYRTVSETPIVVLEQGAAGTRLMKGPQLSDDLTEFEDPEIPPPGTEAKHEFYFLQFPRMSESLRIALNDDVDLRELIHLRGELIRLKIPGSENLPLPFSAGPALVLSLYPEGDQEKLIVHGKLQIAYAEKKDHLRPASMEPEEPGGAESVPEESSPLPGPPLCCFPPDSRLPVYRGFAPEFLQADETGTRVARRHSRKEAKLFGSLPELKYSRKTGAFKLGPRKIRAFLDETLPELERAGVITRVHPSLAFLLKGGEPRSIFEIEESSGTDWFSGRIEIKGLSAEDRARVLQAARERREALQLKNGAWVRLDSLGLDKLMRNLQSLGLAADKNGDVKKIHRGEAVSLAGLLEDEMDTAGARHLRNFIRELKRKDSPKSRTLTLKLGKGFQGKLRDYQQQGVAFLANLFRLGAGGILADDMGLGKTIQCLAFVEHLRNSVRKREPCLLVTPTAALGVWLREAERFFPDLPMVLWHGPNRHELELPRDGILLTSFGVLNRDAERLGRERFRALLVDEAHFARTHSSRIYRNLRGMNAGASYCLTGTPLENNLLEFQALMDLCFPGLLGTRASFGRTFAGNKGRGSIEELRKRVAPFMLRRTKDMVLRELPPRTETDLGVEPTKAQAAVYEQARREAVRELENAGRDYLMKMLPHLMRLRRIACHPRLDKSKDPEASGKFLHLAERLPALTAAASGILLFSQFTDVLTVTENLLQGEGVDYFRLDGSTPAAKRAEMVERFQAGERKCFLISLKAGGTALTLHRADTVVHLDPWWNPAAERQASDRAHRIGQKRPVFVYRLYSTGTVEEKVLALQKTKRRLFDAVMGDDGRKQGIVSREELLELLESPDKES